MITLAVFGLLGALGYYFFTREPTARPTAILLTGPSQAGKTTLFYTLKDGGVKTGTTVSMKENEACFKLHKFAEEDSEPVQMIDYPGEPQLSSRLPDFFPVTKAVLFVIDAHDKASIEKYAAEDMYRLLTHPKIVENAPPVLVVCNQSDFPLAAKCPLLQKILEEELTKLVHTRGVDASLDHEESESEAVPLGQDGVPFSFAEHSPCDVKFVRCSATTGEGLEAVARFCMGEH